MNITNIDWPGLTHTWNPIFGCEHGCTYCYARKVAETRLKGDFKPRLHAERLKDPELKSKKHRVVFVGSMSDMWGAWVPAEWINKVLDVIKENPQHTFMFLTKNPARYQEFFIPDNAWIGASITGEDHNVDRNRVQQLELGGGVDSDGMDTKRFLSIEPLLGPIGAGLGFFERPKIQLMIAGLLTGGKQQFPKQEWLADILFLRKVLPFPMTYFKKSLLSALQKYTGSEHENSIIGLPQWNNQFNKSPFPGNLTCTTPEPRA